MLMRWMLTVYLKLWAAGDQRALQTLSSYYMKTAADMAVEMNIEEMQLADLIQEANLCLIQALGTAGDEGRDEKWLLSESAKESSLFWKNRHRENSRMTVW